MLKSIYRIYYGINFSFFLKWIYFIGILYYKSTICAIAKNTKIYDTWYIGWFCSDRVLLEDFSAPIVLPTRGSEISDTIGIYRDDWFTIFIGLFLDREYSLYLDRSQGHGDLRCFSAAIRSLIESFDIVYFCLVECTDYSFLIRWIFPLYLRCATCTDSSIEVERIGTDREIVACLSLTSIARYIESERDRSDEIVSREDPRLALGDVVDVERVIVYRDISVWIDKVFEGNLLE
jgi:hypothetical protein